MWGQKWYIIGTLVAISLGHWSLLLHGILLTAAWVPGQGCVITSTDSKILSVSFIYSMAFDFIVLMLTASKLIRPTGTRSQLVNLIFTDGLVYFIVAYVFETLRQSRLRRLLIPIFLTVSLLTCLPLCVKSFFGHARICSAPYIGLHGPEPEPSYVHRCKRPSRGYFHRPPYDPN